MSDAFVAIMMSDQERSHELAGHLAARGARPFVASHSDALYEKAGEETIDVLVIENRLNGFLTGLEVTERLQADLARPVTVLLAPDSMKGDPSVKRLGIFHVEPGSGAMANLVEIALTAAERSLLNRPFVCPRAQRLVGQLEGLQPLSPLILKVAAALRESPPSSELLFEDIAADPTASAAVLKIVNSSAIGRSQRTASVAEAIHFLGLKRAMSAVLSAGLVQAQERLFARVPQTVKRWYGRRSVLIASVCESLAKNLEDLPPETAYIHGLLQDSGTLVLAHVYGERYAQLLQRVEEIPHLRLQAEEKVQFGTSHADVTAAFLRRLKLPEPLAAITGRHHAPIAEPAGHAADQSLLRVMQIGEAVANIADLPSPQRLTMLNYLLAQYHERTTEVCLRSLVEAIQRVAELSEILGLPAPDDQSLAKLLENIGRCTAHTPHFNFDPYGNLTREEIRQARPLNDARETGLDPKNEAALPQNPKVLLLEDDLSIVKYVRRALATVGVELMHASSTDDAARLVTWADAVLIDIHLGDEDGVGAVPRIRSTGYDGPIMIISGDGCRSTVERACNARISEYLLKPFTTAQLLEKLQKHGVYAPNPVTSRRKIPSPLVSYTGLVAPATPAQPA